MVVVAAVCFLMGILLTWRPLLFVPFDKSSIPFGGGLVPFSSFSLAIIVVSQGKKKKEKDLLLKRLPSLGAWSSWSAQHGECCKRCNSVAGKGGYNCAKSEELLVEICRPGTHSQSPWECWRKLSNRRLLLVRSDFRFELRLREQGPTEQENRRDKTIVELISAKGKSMKLKIQDHHHYCTESASIIRCPMIPFGWYRKKKAPRMTNRGTRPSPACLANQKTPRNLRTRSGALQETKKAQIISKLPPSTVKKTTCLFAM